MCEDGYPMLVQTVMMNLNSCLTSLIINLTRAVDAPYLPPSAFYDRDSAAGYKCHRTQELHHLSESDLTYLLKVKEHASRFLSTFIVIRQQAGEPGAKPKLHAHR
ncbi:hypothetical protein M378DRAFT_178837 [Amanita muscaria Koide BX008]|uniref:Uncharacterized protein n=1 Tax=Amanita muscaria (strain Koide BX008) TaxID=946122 RepID=A0A0C2WRN1_AMAMK|nr:hypothetical protein M378DRAFT_178837 [Amanita muscaria Koide BX008]